MKLIITSLAVFAIAVLSLSVYNVIRLSGSDYALPIGGDIQAFDPSVENMPAFRELESRISGILKESRQQDGTYMTVFIALNFTVTILAALSVLITSIAAAKYKEPKKQHLIMVAVITFFTTIISWSESQITVLREENKTKMEDVRKIRDEVESLTAEEFQAQATSLNQRLDEFDDR